MKKLSILVLLFGLLTHAFADNEHAIFNNEIPSVYSGIGAKFMMINGYKVTFYEARFGYTINESNAVYLSKAGVILPSASLFTSLEPSNFAMVLETIGYQYTVALPFFVDLALVAEVGTGTFADGSNAAAMHLAFRPSVQLVFNILTNMRINAGYSWQFTTTLDNPADFNHASCYANIEIGLFK